MDIEAIVKKHAESVEAYPEIGLRNALTEMAAGYEQQISHEKETHKDVLVAWLHRMDQWQDTANGMVHELQERIRQLEAERVPAGIVVSSDWLRRIHRDLDACQKVIWLGMRDADPAYCADAKARLKEIDAMLAAAPQQKKEGEKKPPQTNGLRPDTVIIDDPLAGGAGENI